ncbi:hypothetical protein ACFODT_11290 [Vibrio zhugei]|uniref:DUF4375 domain-containing protein n=1 Tax=Vibrio zhugei TaxID=2479546 RepID=A0ABV7C8N9_9VIBR|nr:hypothetical protein [Vibrio zhugei]
MQPQFTVQIDSFQKISQINNAWSNADYRALMHIMSFDEDLDAMDATELREMCMMSLNDQGPEGAAAVVLTHLFPDLPQGKIDQVSHDMLEDRYWEEYANCLYHERFFRAYALLREAFNGTFAEPTGVEMTLTVTAENEEAMTIFDTSLESSMVRLLADGQGELALINRLYDEQIQGTQFPEAPGIVWQLQQIADNGLSRQFHFISSYFWMEAFENMTRFDASSHADSEE